MTIRDLLVHIDPTKSGQARMDYAFGLAEAHKAHVIGIGYSPLGIDRLCEETRKALDDCASAGRRRGLSMETRLIECSIGDLSDEMVLHARHVDLALIGQPEEKNDMAGPQRALFEKLLFFSGRPVLIVPWAGKFDPKPKTVMVAWDASGTATRALADALPILRYAKKVIILVAIGGGQDSSHGDEPGADIALHLARHDIKAEARLIPHGSDISVADLLLSQASDLGAEMMVMGGYHHSRVREFILGGVTRTIVETMTVPVLLSH
jgi:nucleotide-binding universal stress UspA family protein